MLVDVWQDEHDPTSGIVGSGAQKPITVFAIPEVASAVFTGIKIIPTDKINNLKLIDLRKIDEIDARLVSILNPRLVYVSITIQLTKTTSLLESDPVQSALIVHSIFN